MKTANSHNTFFLYFEMEYMNVVYVPTTLVQQQQEYYHNLNFTCYILSSRVTILGTQFCFCLVVGHV
jgi:hypothetical protein